ncbi:MAG TPA: Mpo1-like protein, partial [Kofleriaceae bacterium]
TMFVGGWALQFLGHYFEGRKPAFLDDIKGLLDGPLFLVAEAAFTLGLSPGLRAEVERRAGTTRWGRVAASDLAAAAA